METCTVEGCESKVFQKGLCSKHYSRMKRHGTTEIDNPRMSNKGKVCLADGCEKEAKSKGFCVYHYQKIYLGSEKRKEIQARYYLSEKGKERAKNYYYSEEGNKVAKNARKKYLSTEKGKASRARDKSKRRVAIYSGGYEVFNHFEIFERDNWECKICGLPVDKDLVCPDPMSPSLDHIIPVSKGGPHSFDNCQLAHLTCNMKKGNRTTEQSCEPVSGDS